MLREEDMRLDVSHTSHGGDFMRLAHVPSGISRLHPRPMRGLDRSSMNHRSYAVGGIQ